MTKLLAAYRRWVWAHKAAHAAPDYETADAANDEEERAFFAFLQVGGPYNLQDIQIALAVIHAYTLCEDHNCDDRRLCVIRHLTENVSQWFAYGVGAQPEAEVMELPKAHAHATV